MIRKSSLALGLVLLISLLIALPAKAQAVGRTNIVSSVTLSWNKSTDAAVTGYNVYYGVAPGVYTNQTTIASVNTTTATFTPMVRGTKYYFTATCFTASGLESDYAPEISWTSPPKPGAPAGMGAAGGP